MTGPAEGSRELEHTADWEIEVWGPDLSSLFQQAALGMYALLGLRLAEGPRKRRDLELEAPDAESLLVEFLNELLFLAESEGLGFDSFELSVESGRLGASLEGAPITVRRKEIKAVTYSRLEIRESERGLTTRVVFDV